MSLGYKDVGRRVRLNTDLSRYHPKLVIGAEGVIVETRACFNAKFLSDRAAGVRFDDAGGWDILWDGLSPAPEEAVDVAATKDNCRRAAKEIEDIYPPVRYETRRWLLAFLAAVEGRLPSRTRRARAAAE